MCAAGVSSHDTLLRAFASWRSFTAVVVGDFMLDELVFGDAERLSPEAPVPVLRARRFEHRAGGAANVCLDLAALGGAVRAVGLTGDDPEATRLRECLESPATRIGSGRVDASGLVADPARPTTVKRSLVGLAQARHPQKMFRLDMESSDPPGEEVRGSLLAAVRRAIEPSGGTRADVVCIEDYDKGVCGAGLLAGVMDAAREAGVPVLVDPAGRGDYDKYRGATAITPNRTEAEAATGMKTEAGPAASADHARNAAIARALLERLELEAVVLTLDRHGALLLERGLDPLPVPTVARQVYDVTGAGDMMLAGLAAARCQGLSWPDATRLANAAAGLEVEVFGVQPIPTEAVWAELLRRDREARGAGPVRTAEELSVELAPRRAAGETLVFTNGCFDVLHAGHVSLLEEARALGDVLVVAINADESVRRLKGTGRPVHSAADRARVLGALRAVDAVVIFEEDTPEVLLERLRPDVLVKGGDYSPDQIVGREIVEAAGGRVVVANELSGRSTSAALERILAL